MQTGGGEIGDTSENVGEPGLGIDVVEATGRDHRQHDGGPVGAAPRAGEGPVPASESHHPFILPVSDKKPKFIIGGTPISAMGFWCAALSSGPRASF